MPDIKTETVSLSIADGSNMNAYVARPTDNGRYPGLLVFQEIFGVNHHIRSVTERFAAQGYVALAPDLFHRTAAGFQGVYTDFQPGMKHAQAMKPEGTQADIRAAHHWLSEHAPRVAAVGFCMGGSVSVTANALVPLYAAISFYGGSIAQMVGDRFGDLHGPTLLLWGGLDQHITLESRLATQDTLRKHNKPFVNVEFSDADHGFFCDERSSYNKAAATVAWPLALSFLQAHMA